MQPTNIADPQYFHKVVDCQWACPAHTPVPQYIRLIAGQRYTEAWMVNWVSNVFPGILGRTCDRPCEPACRRTRTHETPVAICRLKRVAADLKGDVTHLLPTIPKKKNGRRIALVGAGPASLTVVRDLAPLGYECHLFEKDSKGGGMMRSQIPHFRLPAEVLEEEVDRILDMDTVCHFNREIGSLKDLIAEKYDAIFVGTGAPRGRNLQIEGREEAAANIHIGIDWLMSVAFEHTSSIGKRVVVLGGGNTAMDCCRSALRMGGEDVQVFVRSPKSEMKASDWEIEEAELEGIPMHDNHVPKAFLTTNGRLSGVRFERVEAHYDDNGKRTLVPTGEPPVDVPCDDVLLAIGQENSFPWIERDIGLEFDKWDMPVVDKTTFRSTHERVYFGGDAAFGPENIIWAVAHGHQAAISIDLALSGKDLVGDRPPPGTSLASEKMGLHEWGYDNRIDDALRYQVPHADQKIALKDLTVEVETGFDAELGYKEAMRCLNCDVQTVFTEPECIECDACVDICPVDCISFLNNDSEENLRQNIRVPAQNPEQDLYVSDTLKTGRIMAKDEDLCLHCGLCAERCPTGAWDMRKFIYEEAQTSGSETLINFIRDIDYPESDAKGDSKGNAKSRAAAS